MTSLKQFGIANSFIFKKNIMVFDLFSVETISFQWKLCNSDIEAKKSENI